MSEEDVEIDVSKFYTAYNDKGQRLHTQFPNALLMAMCGSGLSTVEMRIINFIARTSFGIKNREETYYLGADDFKEFTGIQKSHFSNTIRKMLKEQKIFRGMKSGDKYKYAVNLLRLGCTMKYYRNVNAGYKLRNKEYTFDDESYAFSNKADVKSDTIVYNSDGYDGDDNLQIKIDTKTDTKSDKKKLASARSLGATSAEAVKSKLSTATKSAGASFNNATVMSATDKGASDKVLELEKLLAAFDEEVVQGSASSAVKVMVKHMHILEDAGWSAGAICVHWQKNWTKRNTNNKGEAFNLSDWNEAMTIYQEEVKQRKD